MALIRIMIQMRETQAPAMVKLVSPTAVTNQFQHSLDTTSVLQHAGIIN